MRKPFGRTMLTVMGLAVAAACITVLTASPAKAQTGVAQSTSKFKVPRVVEPAAVPRGVGATLATAQRVSAATAVTTITGPCPIIIGFPGVYSLGADLPCSLSGLNSAGVVVSIPSIFITSSNVTLLLNGHTISTTVNTTGSCLEFSYGIQMADIFDIPPNTLTNVAILGPGTISNFILGIGAFSSARSSVHSVKINSQCPTGQGVFTDQFSSNWVLAKVAVEAPESATLGTGIILDGSNNTITGCNIQQLGEFATGISLIGSNNTVVRCNVNDGIVIFGNSNIVDANIASDSSQAAAAGSDGGGIGVLGNNNQIHGNATKNNSGLNGILVFAGALGNNISGNKSFDNTPFDMEDDNHDCGTNVWVGNKFNTANESCIH